MPAECVLLQILLLNRIGEFFLPAGIAELLLAPLAQCFDISP
ncbi:MAG: hypothetical protein QOD09_502 [Bradyrhizobium sp.]|nr:hypothetical protein [Bradyrhizobium sp.]